LTLPLLLKIWFSGSPHDFLCNNKHSSAAIPSPGKSTPVHAEEASLQVRSSDGRAVLALVTRLRKKLRRHEGVARWRLGHPGPTSHSWRRAPFRGILSPTRAYSAPQARATPAIMRSFHPSANEKRPVACKLVAPAPAFVAEPLRPNTTWHASELHVHSRSCESPVRARERALSTELARELTRDRSDGVLTARDSGELCLSS